MASPAKTAKRHTPRPSAKLRRRPKNLVKRVDKSSGTAKPTRACTKAARKAMPLRYSVQLRPALATACRTRGTLRPVLTPSRMGVPMAPKVTGVL